jgi:hypothetical protein
MKPISRYAVLTTPMDRIRFLLAVLLVRSRTELLPFRAAFPDLKAGRHPFALKDSASFHPRGCRPRHGHFVTFEACSSFTHVMACRVAHPPYVGFIARLRPAPFPDPCARKLTSPTDNYFVRVLPPLVIRAFEAHFKNLRFLMIANTTL